MQQPDTKNRRRSTSATVQSTATPEAEEAVAANLAFGHTGAGRDNDPGADMLEDMRTIANLHGS
jgi:hypothetical protein